MKQNRIPVLHLFLLLAGLSFSCQFQSEETYYNHVAIHEHDSEKDILWKAAHVVPSSRQFEWQRLELTAFAHFGLNTFADRQWGSGFDDPTLFNPTDFDAGQWARTLKEAGFRSLILTCKHHDGFCLWPSEYTDYSVASSPWRDGMGDVVKEVSQACADYGLLFGVYLSPWDRHEQSYGTPEYNDYFVKQLTELLTKYGKISEVWLDGACGEGPNGKKQEYDFDRWYKLIRKLQPECVIAVMGPDVRWVGNERGRGRESEWSVVPNDRLDPNLIAASSQHELIMPPTGVTTKKEIASKEMIMDARTLVWYPAEADVSIRPSWFYTETDDGKTKSAEVLMAIYFNSVGRNCNLLLNIPPDKRGLFGGAEVESLMEFARMREEKFKDNLLSDAEVSISGVKRNKTSAICDGDYDSSVELVKVKGELTWRVYWSWDEAKTFSTLMLQEEIRKGQRVEAFSLEYKDSQGLWQEAVEGSTIGYKRLLEFESVTASEIRLVIRDARHDPVIAEAGLYR